MGVAAREELAEWPVREMIAILGEREGSGLQHSGAAAAALGLNH